MPRLLSEKWCRLNKMLDDVVTPLPHIGYFATLTEDQKPEKIWDRNLKKDHRLFYAHKSRCSLILKLRLENISDQAIR